MFESTCSIQMHIFGIIIRIILRSIINSDQVGIKCFAVGYRISVYYRYSYHSMTYMNVSNKKTEARSKVKQLSIVHNKYTFTKIRLCLSVSDVQIGSNN